MTAPAYPSGEGVREAVARLIEPWAFNDLPAALTRFTGMTYSDPENGHHVWDRKHSSICNSLGPDSRMPWPKLANRSEADAAAEALNNENRAPFLRAQQTALAKADAILALLGEGFSGSSSLKSEDTHRVADGWVLVPTKPSMEMLGAGVDAWNVGGMIAMWSAMLAVARQEQANDRR
jgi:hypothetical protein